jgi:serine/threonine protein kinase
LILHAFLHKERVTGAFDVVLANILPLYDLGDLLAKYSPRGQLRVPSSRSMESVCNARRRDADFVDLLTRCLQWLPEQRITVEECLVHPWLQPDNSSRYTTGTSGAQAADAGGATLSAMTYSESRPDTAEDAVPRKGSQPGVTVPGVPLHAPAPQQTIVVPGGIASGSVVSRDPMMSLHLTPVE